MTDINDLAALEDAMDPGACSDPDTHDIGVRFLELARIWAVTDDDAAAAAILTYARDVTHQA